MIGSIPAPPEDSGPSSEGSDEAQLVSALRCGNERAFAMLVDRHHSSLIRVATAYLGDRAIAEELVQETWLALVKGIERFEGRSSLKTWLFRVLTYQARRRMGVEERTISFEALTSPSLDPSRFLPEGHRLQGHWASAIRHIEESPEDVFLAQETMARIQELVDGLPSRQRVVVVLRDVEGMNAAEVCDILSISDGVQRVLLHRARTKLREGIVAHIMENESIR